MSFLPVGAHLVSDGVSFRVWAPDHRHLRVATGAKGAETRYIELERDAEGFFSGRDEEGRAGDLYWFQVDGRLLPDPASRFQPTGVEGPSQVVDPHDYAWRVQDWRRPPLRGRVIYELHVGAFTPEGTFLATMSKLDALADLGVNAIELMPLNEFPGDRSWGYDGVLPFAPARCYGTPDELRALVDAAHERGLAVIVDVVYNHFGPHGNPLPAFARSYFHPRRHNDWGQGLNFDGEGAGPVRQFFLQNACMWFDEYRVDGLRLDAVHAIEDRSSPHLIAEIAAAARARGGFTIAEDERNDAHIITPADAGGWGVDGMWADDFHHTTRVALTGQQEAHFSGYRGTIAEWVDTLGHGWLYRGQEFPVWGRPRGTACEHLPLERFVLCISNHDQVGNRPLGDRLHEGVRPEEYRALSMLFCLLPHTPMLFMGQEWAASAPFPFFTDLPGELGARMGENRRKEFASRNAHYPPDMLAQMPDPKSEATFRRAKLNWDERTVAPHTEILALYRECLRLRGRASVFQSPPRDVWQIAQLGDGTLGLRARDEQGDWLLLSSFAKAEEESLPNGDFLAPRRGRSWTPLLTSDERRFGGGGATVRTAPESWRIPSPLTVLLRER